MGKKKDKWKASGKRKRKAYPKGYTGPPSGPLLTPGLTPGFNPRVMPSLCEERLRAGFGSQGGEKGLNSAPKRPCGWGAACDQRLRLISERVSDVGD